MPFVVFKIGEDPTESQAKKNCGSAKVAPAYRVMQLLHLLIERFLSERGGEACEAFNDLEI